MPPYRSDQVRPYGVTPPPNPAKPKRKGGLWLAIAAFLGLCVVGGILAGTFAAIGKGGPGQVPSSAWAEPAPTVTVTKTVVATAPAVKQPANTKAKVTAAVPTTVGDGTWEVGAEVQPGTYTVTSDGYCYWARLKNFDGELDSIITNGNLDPGARGRVTVRKSDKGIELAGGCTWKRK